MKMQETGKNMGPAETLLRKECADRSLRYVDTRGNLSAPVCIIGEGPGADEDQNGVPFCGASGKELERMLCEAGFQPNDYWLTNVYKVRPPNNELGRLHELGIPDSAYTDQLFEELSTYKPTIIIVLGATALGVLCPDTRSKRDGASSIGKWRGSLLRSSKLQWSHYVVPCVHPAAVLREWGERQIAVLCLGKAYEEAQYYIKNGKLQPLPVRELITEPSYQQVMEFLHEADQSPNYVSNDIETFRRHWPYTIAVATSPYRAISFSFWRYDNENLLRIWRELDNLLRTHKTIGQNWIGFDCHQLYALGFSPNPQLADDTMVRHHTLWPEFEHKLQFQGFQYTREPYWKDEGREWNPSEGLQSLMHYNALDAAATYEIFLAQERDFDDRPHLRDFYNNVAIRRARAYYRMDDRGLLVDRARLGSLRDYVLREIDKNCIEAEQLVGRPVASITCMDPTHKTACKCNIKAIALAKGVKMKDVFNLGSPKQVMSELESHKIKIPIKRATKGKASRPTVDETALRKIVLANPNEKLPFTILNIRELLKAKGTYIDATLLDGILYSSFAPTATLTFRSGSRINSFGFGNNSQNWPKHSELGIKYRKCIVARPGKVFVACDQKGAEDWLVCGIIADIGGDMTGLNELLSGVNRHRKLASFLFGKPEADIDKGGTEYFLAKKVRHASNYGMGDETMADNLLKDGFTLPRQYCAYLLQKCHEATPGVHNIYQKYIENLLNKTRTIRNPLGFERTFFDLRSFSDNNKAYREGYAQLPQSSVACNNGMAIIYLDDLGYYIVKDDHDSVTLEVDDKDETVIQAVKDMTKAYDREMVMPNGLRFTIPVEFEIGFNLGEMETVNETKEKCGSQYFGGVTSALQRARQSRLSSLVVR